MRPAKYGSACWQLPDFFAWVDLIQLTSFYIVPRVLIKMRQHNKKGVTNVSANNKENDVRDMVEKGTNWLWVIRNMDKDFFVRCFQDRMIYPDSYTDEEIMCEKYFLLLGNPNPFVQNAALCYLNEIYNEIRECLTDKYRYTRKEIRRDAVLKGLASYYLGLQE